MARYEVGIASHNSSGANDIHLIRSISGDNELAAVPLFSGNFNLPIQPMPQLRNSFRTD